MANEIQEKLDQPEEQQPEPQEAQKGYDWKIWTAVVLAAAAIVGGLVLGQTRESEVVVTNFEECVAATGAVAESYPRQCFFEDQTFVEDVDAELSQPVLSYHPETTSWVEANFPYGIDISISYPANWAFSCCGDKDTESNHFFIPPGTVDDDFSSPRVVLTDFNLQACPKRDDICSIDEAVTISAEKFFAQKREELGFAMQMAGVNTSLAFNQEAYSYIDTQNDKEIYLFKTDSSVYTLTFQGASQFSELLKQGFLERMRGDLDVSEWKTYRNAELGFEFKYPSSWRLIDSGNNLGFRSEFGNVVAIRSPSTNELIEAGEWGGLENNFEVSFWKNINDPTFLAGSWIGMREYADLADFSTDQNALKRTIGEATISGHKGYEVTIANINYTYGILIENQGIYQLRFGQASDDGTSMQGIERGILESFKFLN